MIRALGFFGFAVGFFTISPEMREVAGDTVASAAAYFNAHSPYSYILVAAGAFGIMALLARSATAPRG